MNTKIIIEITKEEKNAIKIVGDLIEKALEEEDLMKLALNLDDGLLEDLKDWYDDFRNAIEEFENGD